MPLTPKKSGLTRRQLELFNLIRKYIEENEIAPTFDEMRIGMRLKSKSHIHSLVTGLITRKKITYIPGRARSVWIVDGDPRDPPVRDVEKIIAKIEEIRHNRTRKEGLREEVLVDELLTLAHL